MGVAKSVALGFTAATMALGACETGPKQEQRSPTLTPQDCEFTFYSNGPGGVKIAPEAVGAKATVGLYKKGSYEDADNSVPLKATEVTLGTEFDCSMAFPDVFLPPEPNGPRDTVFFKTDPVLLCAEKKYTIKCVEP